MTHDLHRRLAELAEVAGAEQVVDLGAGQGHSLVEVAHRAPQCRLTGVDLNPDALNAMAARLPQAHRLRHDLAEPLPFADGSVDAVISHNTMECLQDPGALLMQITRVLRPEGRAVLGHTDFETIVVVTADRDLSRRVLLTYAQLPVLYRYMAAAEPQMGRRLPGLVRRSALQLQSVEAHTTVETSLTGAAVTRLTEVAQAVRRSANAGLGHVTLAELEEWDAQLHAAQDAGEFLFAETAFLVTAVRPR